MVGDQRALASGDRVPRAGAAVVGVPPLGGGAVVEVEHRVRRAGHGGLVDVVGHQGHPAGAGGANLVVIVVADRLMAAIPVGGSRPLRPAVTVRCVVRLDLEGGSAWQVAAQPSPGVPLAGPSSHCSPALEHAVAAARRLHGDGQHVLERRCGCRSSSHAGIVRAGREVHRLHVERRDGGAQADTAVRRLERSDSRRDRRTRAGSRILPGSRRVRRSPAGTPASWARGPGS